MNKKASCLKKLKVNIANKLKISQTNDSICTLNFPPMRPPGILVKTKVDKLSTQKHKMWTVINNFDWHASKSFDEKKEICNGNEYSKI